METTPSLACANKCVFCWRHHTNPVGTEWKWKMDEAELIFEAALKNHYTMINEFKVTKLYLDSKKNFKTARNLITKLFSKLVRIMSK